ncbi:hypothetical protein Fcan01_16423 [Folsomia candida]|uniref:Uncharacterized protein n=1 Tax=Folsomia candida TaxID=158441 RepID=A0A226DTJ0_FOLCA|nr:hypothetical protein Fcan01_16423 [Folsomia candida]
MLSKNQLVVKLCSTILLGVVAHPVGAATLIDNLLSLVQTNCDLQIIHDAEDSKIFQRSEPLVNPTLIFHVENFDHSVTTDVFQARPNPCRVALFVINFLTYTQIRWPEKQSYYLPTLIETVQDKQFHFIQNEYKIILPAKNIYTIILTNSENSSLLDNSSKIFSEIIYNFGVAYISRNLKLVKLCIKTFDTLANVKCLKEINDICKLFTKRIPLAPRFWRVSPSLEPFNGANNLEFTNPETSTNPFKQRGNRYSLAQVVFRHANVTVINAYDCIDMKTACGAVKLQTINDPIRHGFAKSVPVIWTGFEFFSCFKETFISFEFYVNPFQKEVWTALLISIFTVLTSIYLYLKVSLDGGNISLSPWLFVLSTLFEEPPTISNRKLEAHFMFRFVLGSWCLVAVILTNCYNGLMITDLNAPLSSIKPENFGDLIGEQRGGPISLKQLRKRVDFPLLKWYNLAVLSHTYQYSLDGKYNNFRNPYESKDCFKLLSPAEEHSHYRVQYFQFFEFLISEYNKFPLGSDLSNDKQVVSRASDLWHLNLLHPRHGHFPSGLDYSSKEYSLDEINHKIETEVVDCSEKNVFVTRGKYFRVQYKFLREKYSSKEFYKGKDVLNSKPIALEFLNEGSSKVPRYFEGLIETGIYARIEEEIEARQVLEMVPVEKPLGQRETEAFGLNGSIVTLFILCGFVILGALTSFLYECHARIIQFFRSICYMMNKFIAKIKTLI